MIVYECLDAWEIRIGDELHGLRFTLESALARARDVAAFHRKPAWLLYESASGGRSSPERLVEGLTEEADGL